MSKRFSFERLRLSRLVGGLFASLAVAGAADAQTPAFAPRAKPAFVPNKTAADIQQTAMKSDAGLPVAPAPAPALPVMAAPAAATPAVNSDLPCAADIAAACGESCGPAMDALCGPPGRFWFGAEYLFWGGKGNNLPPLVTGAPVGTPRNVAGTIGGPGTTNLIGNQTVNNEFRSGLRVYGGLWLDQGQRFGLEADYFFLGRSSFSAADGSNGSRVVTRPFTDNARSTGGTFSEVAAYPNTQLVSFPGVLSGTAQVESTNEFTGFGANFVRNLHCDPCGRLDFLLGYRFLYLRDRVEINEDLTGINPNAGTRFQVNDQFVTRNYFNGGVLGLAYERRFSHFYLNLRSTVALGNTRSVIDINGSTVISPSGGAAPTRFAGGLLAQPSNIGSYTRDGFAVVPEVTGRLGVQVTEHLRLFTGYNFIYWSNVIRPENVIDLRVNSSQIPPRANQTGTLFPQFNPTRTDFWAHGIMFGAEFRY